jgi:hypothetical protein
VPSVFGINLNCAVRHPTDRRCERLGNAVGVLEHAVRQSDAVASLPANGLFGTATAASAIRDRVCSQALATTLQTLAVGVEAAGNRGGRQVGIAELHALI